MLLHRRLKTAKRPGHVIWEAHHEPNEIDNSVLYPGLGRWYVYGDNVQDSGNATRPASGVTTEQAHSGTQSGKMSIDTTGDVAAGCRSFLSTFTEMGMTLYYSFWLYHPAVLIPQHLQNMQFKTKQQPDGGSGVVWGLRVGNIDAENMVYYLTWDLGVDTGELGPHAGEDYTAAQWQKLPLTLTPIPVGRWFNVEAYLKQSSTFDGHLTIWIDGVQQFNEAGVKTKPPGNWVNTWSITNYGILDTPTNADLYFDDAVISTGRIWRRR